MFEDTKMIIRNHILKADNYTMAKRTKMMSTNYAEN